MTVVQQEAGVPNSFEEYLSNIATVREGKLGRAMWVGILSILLPILGTSYLLQALVLLKWSAMEASSVSVTVCILSLYIGNTWSRKAAEYLNGRLMFLLTFRTRSGFCIQDYALVSGVRPLEIGDSLTQSDIKPYEITFEDFPYFDAMILYSPCPIENLYIPQTIPVLWKNFIVNASTAILSVIRLKEFSMGEEGIIPHVYPSDCDFIADHWWKAMELPIIKMEDVEAMQEVYETIKFIEIKTLYAGAERDLASKDRVIKQLDTKAADMAAFAIEHNLETGKRLDLSGKSIVSTLWKYKKWLIMGVIVASVVLLFLYGGRLLK